MASREQLEDWVERWLQANRDAEAAGGGSPGTSPVALARALGV